VGKTATSRLRHEKKEKLIILFTVLESKTAILQPLKPYFKESY